MQRCFGLGGRWVVGGEERRRDHPWWVRAWSFDGMGFIHLVVGVHPWMGVGALVGWRHVICGQREVGATEGVVQEECEVGWWKGGRGRTLGMAGCGRG